MGMADIGASAVIGAGTLITSLLSMAVLLLIPIYVIGMGILQYILAVKFDDKKIIILIVFLFLNFPGAIVSAAVYSMMYQHKYNKASSEIVAKLTSEPSDSVVDEYIAHINRFGCEDKPNAWHQVRGVWYACNNSNNVTTEKKKELLTLLLLKGLYLNNDEKKIIDNYGK